jgi:hypothetical protein
MAFGRDETAGARAMWALGGLISIALGIVLVMRPCASPDLHAVLADDVRKAAAAGRRLDFVLLGALDGQARGTGEPT